MIDQIKVSFVLPHFKDGIIQKYKLKEYYSNTKPSFFYGLYHEKDIKYLFDHKSLKIIIWSGADINYKKSSTKLNIINKIKKLDNVYHIANSKFISNTLTSLHIPHIRLPICGIDITKYKPIVKGNSIYIYSNPTRESIYGKKIYDKLIKQLPKFNFIFATNLIAHKKAIRNNNRSVNKFISHDANNMIDLYKKCFIGLRLTEHDGIAYTVLELGLCGIKCVHNGDQPNALKYHNINDIVNHIKTEYQTYESIDNDICNKVNKYLTLHADWKYVNYYHMYFKNQKKSKKYVITHATNKSYLFSFIRNQRTKIITKNNHIKVVTSQTNSTPGIKQSIKLLKNLTYYIIVDGYKHSDADIYLWVRKQKKIITFSAKYALGQNKTRITYQLKNTSNNNAVYDIGILFRRNIKINDYFVISKFEINY